MSLADGELRDQVRAVLAQSEQRHRAQVVSAWQRLAELFGYRLRPELGATFETLATLLDATMRGLVIMALPTPELAARRVQASPFGAARENEWSLPATGLAGIAAALLEPDPAIEWNKARINSLRQALTSLALPNA
jgi:hypothetical protein